MLTKHITATTITNIMTRNHFQDGRGAFVFARQSGIVPVDALRLEELDNDWKDINILNDVGVSENTITLLCQKIRDVNSIRPAAARKTETEECQRFLECIFRTSKHFSEGALIEYQAAPGFTSLHFYNRIPAHVTVRPCVRG